ncbi:MAG: GNAT family N-acetyltransferase [Rickettsiales bacterium]
MKTEFEYSIKTSRDTSPAKLKIIDGLRRYNAAKLGYWGNSTNITIEVYKDKVLVAGIIAYYAGYFSKIGWLWVDEEHRSKGIGSKLLQLHASHVRKNACTMVYTDTFNPQAVKFYTTNGFQQIGVIENYINSESCYFLRMLL